MKLIEMINQNKSLDEIKKCFDLLEPEQKQKMIIFGDLEEENEPFEPFILAIEKGNLNLCKWLLDQCDSEEKREEMITAPGFYGKYEPFKKAAAYDRPEMLKFLLDQCNSEEQRQNIIAAKGSQGEYDLFQWANKNNRLLCAAIIFTYANKENRDKILALNFTNNNKFLNIINHSFLSPINAACLLYSNENSDLNQNIFLPINVPILELMQQNKTNPMSAFKKTTTESAKTLGKLAIISKYPKEVIARAFSSKDLASLALLTIENNGEVPDKVTELPNKKDQSQER